MRPVYTHLVSTRRDRQRELTIIDKLLPERLEVKVRFDRSAAEEEQIVCIPQKSARLLVKICAKKQDSPFAPVRMRSSIKARKGATPVPGPITIRGAGLGGSRS